MIRVREDANKDYVSVFLDVISLEAFRKSEEVREKMYDSGHEHVIVNISKEGRKNLNKYNMLSIHEMKKGEVYNVLGTEFKVIATPNETQDGSLVYEYKSYGYPENQITGDIVLGVTSCVNFTEAVLGITYLHATGYLFFF
ncbi:hypothetical protein [Listeria welshimeri]|uniref:hypothetical protein n=1 Tax=Listeria welshimeri TaxID=1643 RepID=UPI001626D24D|nr:hypothetical protein [Listeria welshimeri]MBC1342342.1 hypothetical protein [Listeria welshimeri]MBC1350705.1 hypothetical protein [Listeria welshimeri]MBC1705846.1 hypothetical protein [Listeria welshimeri]MBF2342537.1 hypothetical protein [Listeria welshimeri]